jgi:hypothetical protein
MRLAVGCSDRKSGTFSEKGRPMRVKATCGAKTRPGHPCRNPAGFKTDHVGFGRCAFHNGATPTGRTAAARERATVEAHRFGIAIETDPHEALATAVNIRAGHVGFLQRLVQQLDDGEVITQDQLHPVVRALNSELEQWQRAAKAAADAGTAKRRADLDEFVIAGLADAVRRALSDVDSITSDQEDEILGRLSHHVQALDELDDWRAPRELVA